VDLEALPPGEPGADLGMLVGGVVVDDEVDVEPSATLRSSRASVI
jgi:hypothetical protein